MKYGKWEHDDQVVVQFTDDAGAPTNEKTAKGTPVPFGGLFEFVDDASDQGPSEPSDTEDGPEK
jgi:hypothetical protein